MNPRSRCRRSEGQAAPPDGAQLCWTAAPVAKIVVAVHVRSLMRPTTTGVAPQTIGSRMNSRRRRSMAATRLNSGSPGTSGFPFQSERKGPTSPRVDCPGRTKGWIPVMKDPARAKPARVLNRGRDPTGWSRLGIGHGHRGHCEDCQRDHAVFTSRGLVGQPQDSSE